MDVKSSRRPEQQTTLITHVSSHTRMEIPATMARATHADFRRHQESCLATTTCARRFQNLTVPDLLDNLTPRTDTTLYVSKKQTETHRRQLPWHRLWPARLWRLPPR